MNIDAQKIVNVLATQRNAALDDSARLQAMFIQVQELAEATQTKLIKYIDKYGDLDDKAPLEAVK